MDRREIEGRANKKEIEREREKGKKNCVREKSRADEDVKRERKRGPTASLLGEGKEKERGGIEKYR